mmetsp:Transcript_15318/g.37582  ORF Transcript_15318/g.37582 Transcript_15318/m.37582 type:complete len:320 (-) Transcript_15318:831-1790(-)
MRLLHRDGCRKGPLPPVCDATHAALQQDDAERIRGRRHDKAVHAPGLDEDRVVHEGGVPAVPKGRHPARLRSRQQENRVREGRSGWPPDHGYHLGPGGEGHGLLDALQLRARHQQGILPLRGEDGPGDAPFDGLLPQRRGSDFRNQHHARAGPVDGLVARGRQDEPAVPRQPFPNDHGTYRLLHGEGARCRGHHLARHRAAELYHKGGTSGKEVPRRQSPGGGGKGPSQASHRLAKADREHRKEAPARRCRRGDAGQARREGDLGGRTLPRGCGLHRDANQVARRPFPCGVREARSADYGYGSPASNGNDAKICRLHHR